MSMHSMANGRNTSAPKFLQRYPLKPEDYDTFPEFNYEEEPVSAMLLRLIPSLLGMFILFLGVVIVPFRGAA